MNNRKKWQITAGALVLLFILSCIGCAARRGGESRPASAEKKYSQAMQSLQSNDRRLREKSAIQLLAVGTPGALRAVKKRIGEQYPPEVRADMIGAAAFTVAHDCFPEILDALNAENEIVREAAAKAISRFGEPEEVDALIAEYEARETSAQTRVSILRAIQRGVFFDGIPVLLRALQSDNERERQVAREALRVISGRKYDGNVEEWEEWWRANKHRSRGDFLANRLWVLRRDLEAAQKRATRLETEVEYLSNLVTSGQTNNVDSLLKALVSPYPRVQGYAAYRLSEMDTDELKRVSLDKRQTYNIFRKALATAPAAVRQDVVDLAVNLDGKYRNALLVEALSDDDPGVLVMAIDGLTDKLSDTVQKRVVEALESPYPEVREAAANALGRTDCRDAISALIKTLDDPEENVRWFSVESIRKLGGTKAVPQLGELVEGDSSARVREIAATALGELGQPGAVPSLREALSDKNERVRERAASSLQTLGQQSFERALVVADALDQNGFWEEAVALLRKAVKKGEEKKAEGRVRAARMQLAALLQKAGKHMEAAAIYEKIVGHEKVQKNVRKALVKCWIKGGEPERAKKAIEKWLQVKSKEQLSRTLSAGVEAAKMLKPKYPELAEDIALLILPRAQELSADETIQRLRKLGWVGKTDKDDDGEEEKGTNKAGTENE